jgi:hypothetical protein
MPPALQVDSRHCITACAKKIEGGCIDQLT